MTYTPQYLRKRTLARAEDINAEFDKIKAAISASEDLQSLAFAPYRQTFAEAVKDFSVGGYFTSNAAGDLRTYKRVNIGSGYEDMGDDAAPISRAGAFTLPISAAQQAALDPLYAPLFANIPAMSIPAGVNSFRTRDRAGALWVSTSADLDPVGEGKWWTRSNSGSRKWLLEVENPLTSMFGAVGTSNDTALIIAADAYCDEYRQELRFAIAQHTFVGDYTFRSPWHGASRERSEYLTTGRLFPGTGVGLSLKSMRIASTMQGVAGLNSVIQAGGVGGGTTPRRFAIDDCEIEFLPNLGTGYHPSNNRRMLQFDASDGLSITRSTLIGGSLWLNANNTEWDISHNIFKRGYNAEQGIGLGDDMIKASTNSSKGKIAFNFFDSPEQDCIDLYTNGSKTTIVGNTGENYGVMGIQAKALYRWAPFINGSSDQGGKLSSVIITDNGFYSGDMRGLSASDQGGAIYIHVADLRFQVVSAAVAGTGGAVRLTISSIMDSTDGGTAYANGDLVRVSNVLGTVEANTIATLQNVNVANETVELAGVPFVNTYQHDTNGTITRAWAISEAVAGTDGYVRLTATGHLFQDGNTVIVTNVGGTVEANVAEAVVRRVDANKIELVGVPFANAYTGGGHISLVLSEKNCPSDITVTDNIIRGVNTARRIAYAAGIVIEGANIELSSNTITEVLKASGSPTQAGAGIVVGRMKPSFAPVLPANVKILGGTAQGESAGLAIAARVRSLHISAATLGQDAETGRKSDYGIVFATGASADVFNLEGGDTVGTVRSMFAASATGYNSIKRADIGGHFDGIVDLPCAIDTLTWMGGSVDGAIILGATSKVSKKITINTIVNYAGTSSALRIFGCKGVTVGGQVYGGDRAIQLDGSSDWAVGVAVLAPASSININNSSANGSRVQINMGTHGLAAGDYVLIAGHSVAGVNGKWVVDSVPSSTTAVLQGSTYTALGSGGTLKKLIDAPAGVFGEITAISAP